MGLFTENSDNITYLQFGVDRLKQGLFTEEEIHNLHGTVSVCEFAKECELEQRKLCGFAPDADKVMILKASLRSAVKFMRLMDSLDDSNLSTLTLAAYDEAKGLLNNIMNGLLE